ncbi:MAG: metallophosphoesterase, partial [Azonexus sp.]|nr:metallophosphoesterase [Azonexus sp.]
AHAVLPGNHDERTALRAAFAGQNWSHPQLACQRVDVGEFTLLLLDTAIAGVPGGEFSPAQEAWLDQHCPSERRVLLAMHHPPAAVGIPILDTIACAGSERLAAWLAGRPNVEAVLCGHVHRLVFTTLANRPLFTAPSTVHQIALQDGLLAYTLEPAGFLVHDWLPGQALRTHYLPLAVAPVINYPA